MDEITLEGGETGMSFRVRDTASGAWTIYWVNSRDGRLQAPVTGSWRDGVFEGVGVDSYAGRQIVARYLWSDISETTARWEQAFSVRTRDRAVRVPTRVTPRGSPAPSGWSRPCTAGSA